METPSYHVPVLLAEVLDFLQVKKGKKYIDCNLGDGGHTIEILKQGGKVLGIDSSTFSFDRALQRINSLGLATNFMGLKGNFKDVKNLVQGTEFEQVSGILFDLGISSPQLESGELGLSFLKDESLDMRLDETLGVSAADMINTLPERDLASVFREFGEENQAHRFASAIVKARSLKRISTTREVAEICRKVSPGYEKGRIHPATRVFQALRILVNTELENLKKSLPDAAQLLGPRGRMVVISFHSLEDRIVKEFGRAAQHSLKVLTPRPVMPSLGELERNPRARSAKMRVFEKNESF